MSKMKINIERLSKKIETLAQIGALEGGGVCRLAFTEDDKKGIELVISWMKELGLEVKIDKLGNTVGIRKGLKDGPPVMMGSHIDTVTTAGPYDGCLGVLAGLEVINTLNDNNIQTESPIAVAFFTNEEGSRFQPDMMGSLVYQGDLPLETALNTVGIDGTTVKENLEKLQIAGSEPCGNNKVKAYFELHVEQGPVLESENIDIGAVECVQGISWTEINIEGQSCHAGCTPMRLRKDAGYAASMIASYLRTIAKEIGKNQLATVGYSVFQPNLVNVVPNKVTMTADLRNTDEKELQKAEKMLQDFIKKIEKEEGVCITTKTLARFEPVNFNTEMVNLVETNAKEMGYSVKRMPSGAGHDAQILARICPSGMIFVPSKNGISHNIEEFTEEKYVEAGANILLASAMKLASAKVLQNQ